MWHHVPKKYKETVESATVRLTLQNGEPQDLSYRRTQTSSRWYQVPTWSFFRPGAADRGRPASREFLGRPQPSMGRWEDFLPQNPQNADMA